MRPLIYIVLMASLFLAACAAPTPSAEPSDGYPLNTKTGNPDVDPILADVASGDPDQVRSLIRYTSAPCTRAEGMGGPPKCREGEAEGTLLEVLPMLDSEGGFFRKEEIGNWKGIDPVSLYAVYQVSSNALNEQYYPQGDYIAFYKAGEDQTAVALHIADGGIVRVDNVYGVFPDSLQAIIERDTSEVILAPETR